MFVDVCGRIEGKTIIGESIKNMPPPLPPLSGIAWSRCELSLELWEPQDWRDVLGGCLHTRI